MLFFFYIYLIGYTPVCERDVDFPETEESSYPLKKERDLQQSLPQSSTDGEPHGETEAEQSSLLEPSLILCRVKHLARQGGT